MARVVAVHGINNTYSAPEMMAKDWVPALMGGVTLAGHPGLLAPEDVTCVFYGDLFRRPGRYLGVDDLETLDPDDVDDPADIELLARWWGAAADTDPGVVPPGTRTLGGYGVQAALAALANSRFLAETSERLLILWLRQVRSYFTKAEIRQQVQARFTQAIAPDTRVVVAHSLGSVVAYEGLAAHPHRNVPTLVTLGSPLGIRNVILDRLQPAPDRTADGAVRGRWPGGVTRWTNIADRRDFVALVKKLHEVFAPELVDIEIDNGARMHRVDRYLTTEQTGAAVARGLLADQRR
jgi:hypothetical protein